MREKRIGILLVQEAHLNEEREDSIKTLFRKRLKVFRSEDPENPTGKGGVAVVLNRQLTNVSGVTITEIIPGRAIHVKTNWHREEIINIMGVYAPNDPTENAKFWKDIEGHFDTHPRLGKADLMGGDFNMVKDAMSENPNLPYRA
ncbi:hypothetical protein C8J57DRAFT_1224796 [Mycena rebaudengoi]|nr:hypothetical protein C8J57DRAFT_1224796 [Mycena rebaudengoi]